MPIGVNTLEFLFDSAEEGFRREVVEFLEAELPPGWFGILSPEEQYESDENWTLTKRMARKLGRKGWLSLAWPKEYGGLERPLIYQAILTEELFYRGSPGFDIFGVGMLAPILISHGTDEQRRKHLEPIAKGEIFWCEGFSETEAGSDLASLQTRARREGDKYIIDGQKTWNTGAHRADWCFFLARTDPQAPKHQGISFFVVDMKTPGITVRPLVNMLGAECFSEIFFDNVVIPSTNLVGEENQGWRVATSLLTHERSGIDRIAISRHALDKLVSCVREAKVRNVLARQRLAEMAIEIEIGRLLAYRVAWLQSKGASADWEGSLSKLYGSELMRRVALTALQIFGLPGNIKGDSKWAIFGGRMLLWYYDTLGRTISGGSSEIQRNIIAMRGLGLPRG
jgi:alkylation response protein AidB-like acyl-CoA dehydrogenase